MGRASNRKKARRQAADKTQRAGQSSRAGTAPQQAMLPLVAGLQALNQELGARGEQQAPAYRAWCGGREPVPAEGPRWAEVSPRDVVRVGLTILSVLAELCKSGSASILRRAA